MNGTADLSLLGNTSARRSVREIRFRYGDLVLWVVDRATRTALVDQPTNTDADKCQNYGYFFALLHI